MIKNVIWKSKINPKQLSFIFLVLGISVRLIQYLNNRSLWADEATLALNIVERSYLELLQPLDYDQGAPVGFLLLTKFLVQWGGNNEYSLRFLPLLSGIFSLIIFYRLASHCLSKWSVPIAVSLFATLEHLVYYSFEFKQYAIDVFVALFLVWIFFPNFDQKFTQKQIVLYSLFGAIAIWFSHPAVFVLAGIGLTTLRNTWNNRDFKKLKHWGIIYVTWLISFVSFYFLSIRSLTNDDTLMTSWRDAFPNSMFDLIWGLDALGKFFYDPLGFVGITDGIAIFAFLIGCIYYFNQKRTIFYFLLSPLFFTLLASYLHQFPFRGRLVLFLTPFIILFIAEGILIWIKNSKYRLIQALGIFVLLALTIPPFLETTPFLVKPYYQEEIKTVLNYIEQHQQPEEALYVYQRGRYQFLYYAPKYGYEKGDYVLGVDDLDHLDGYDLSQAEIKRYKQDINALRGQKVWFLFSHSNVAAENEMMKNYLNQVGEKLDEFSSIGAFTYLYDLR